MNQCAAGSQRQIDAAVAAKRTAYLNSLADCCEQEGLCTGPLHGALGARWAACLDHFLPALVRAGASAHRNHCAYGRASSSVFALGALAVVIVAAQHLFHLPHLLIIGEIACIGGILFIFHRGNHSRWHRNWVDCRYFAERTRSGLFVAFLCGKTVVPQSVRWSDRMMDGAWCNPAYHELMSSRPRSESLPETALPVLRRFMVTHWIGEQITYQRATAGRMASRHRIVSRLGETLFWLTLTAAILHLTPHEWRRACGVERILTDNLLTFVVITLPVIGTALAGVRGHFEFKKIATRSAMIAAQLESLRTEAESARDLAELALLVLRAEEFMIQENAGWHLHAGSKVIPSEA